MNTRTLKGIRKALSVIGILSILSSLVVSIPVASAYEGKDAPYGAEQVDLFIEKGALDAELSANFDKTLTRDQAALMLVNALGLSKDDCPEDFEVPFKDYKEGEWWSDAAFTAACHGLFAGQQRSDGAYFDPAGPFTKEQIAVVLANAVGGEAEEVESDEAKACSSWAQASCQWAIDEGVATKFKGVNAKAVSRLDAVVMGGQVVSKVDEGEFELALAPEEGDEGEEEEDEGEGEEEEEEGEGEEVETPTEGETPVVPAGTATVALASDTPTGSAGAPLAFATGTAFNKLLKFSVAAGSDGDVKLKSVTVTRGGLAANAWVNGVGIFDENDVRHGNIGTSWNDNNKMEINLGSEPIVVTKGTTAAVWVKVNLATGANSGTLNVSIAADTDITAEGTLSGTFPIVSNTANISDGANTVAAVTVDAVQVHSNGTSDATAVNINLGTTNQHVATFRLANSAVEAVKLSSLTLYNNGSAADGDLKNVKLVAPDGSDLKVVADGTKSKYLAFSGLSYDLAKSASSKDFKLYADIVGGSTRTARFILQNDYDLVLMGSGSGANILPTVVGGGTPTGNDRAFPIGDVCGGATTTSTCNMITVSAGTLSFSRASNSATGNIPAGGTGVVIGSWEVKPTGEDMEIRQLAFSVGRSASTNLAGTFYLRLKDVGTLYSVAGSTAALYSAGTYTSTFQTLKSGTTYTIEAVADVLSTAADGLTYNVTNLDITQVKRISTNDIVDPTVTPASSNTLTVRTGTLTVTIDSGATAPQVVTGQSASTILGTWNFTAGPAEGITLTSVIVDDNSAGIGRNFKELELWIDGAKRSQDTSSTQSPTATTQTVTFNISPSYTIAASQTAVVELKGKLLSATTDATVIMQIAASGVTGNGVTSQAALSTVPAAAVNGQTVTINAAGTLTVSRDTVTNVKSSQVTAGSTAVTFGAFKLQTGNIEDVRIKKLTLVNIGSNTDGLQNIGVYDGATLLNDNEATTGNEGILKASLGADSAVLGNSPKSVTFDYSASPYVIPKNSFKVLTVKANTIYSATGGQTVQFAIGYVEAEGAGSSTRIYVTQTTEITDASAANAWAVGQVLATSTGTIGGAWNAACTTGTACNGIGAVSTAVAAAATLVGAGAPLAGITFTTANITKLNTVMNGSSIVSEAPSTAATYSYAVGDVLAITDADTVINTGVAVVTTAVAVAATLLTSGTPVAGVPLATGDRITRLHGGFSEAVSATATTVYNLGDILAVTDDNVPANNGLYTVANAVASGGTMIGAAAANNVVHLQSGATLTTSDRVAKMPTQSTELVSATATYAYSVGDVIVVDDASTAANNGVYVVRTAVAVGAALTGTDTLGIGVDLLAADRISKLFVQSQEDNVKRLYPTKLNFAWLAASGGTVLTPGNGAEVARFTLGADAANANNPGSSVSVTGLNFTPLSTARLSRFMVNDVTNNADVTATNGANSSNFSSSAAGGALSTLVFQQGETRTFKITADTGTNVVNQGAQFRFNSGTHFTAGTATWTTGSQTSTWTALTGDVADLTSAAQTAASASDAVAPTMIIASSSGSADNSIIDEVFTVTFSERIDPATINASLAFNGSVAAVAATATGGIVSPTATALDVLITGIASLTGNTASNAAATNGTVTLALAAYSACTTTCVLTITPTGYSAWHSTATSGDTGAQTVASTSFVVRDTAGNLVTHTGSTSTGLTDL